MGRHNGALNGDMKEALVVGQTSQGMDIHATLLRLTRHQVVFEIYSPSLVLRTSEVLSGFKIIADGRTLYAGRAVLRNLIDAGPVIVCEAGLEDSWQDVDFFPPQGWEERLRDDFARFVASSQKAFRVLPEFKVAVADLQMALMDLRLWLEQVELGIRSQAAGDRLELEKQTILAIQEPIVKSVLGVLDKFELIAGKVEADARTAHINYMKRQIHPLVLCSPFIHRTFYKPLGYAGDYEMVNMMVRDPYEGGSVFAKLINRIFLSTPPVEAHRDRLKYLTRIIRDETLRVFRRKRAPRVFNMGCGPAIEVQDFLAHHDVGQQAHFTLVDFNAETLAYVSKTLADLKRRYNASSQIQAAKKTVNQLIKESFRVQNDSSKYDLIYCAGLFDYFPDSVCRTLMNIFYDSVAPGGLLVATNVSDSNPSRNWMEYVLDWHLIYRNARQLAALAPGGAPTDGPVVRSVGSGVNLFLEVRKPDYA